MAFTKIVAKHDKITIGGTDYSNAFNEFGFTSEHSTVDASGFSVSGVDETQPGNTAQGFAGTMFVTDETVAGIFPLHINKTPTEITWQPNGLIDSGATIFRGTCTINTFSPSDTRGSVSTTPFSATIADENGIVAVGT